MKHFVLFLLACISSLALAALFTSTARAEGITDTCSISFTWKSRVDDVSHQVSEWTSTFDQGDQSGSQHVTFRPQASWEGGDWPETHWVDVFSVTNLLAGTIITIETTGSPPYSDWAGTTLAPAMIRCYADGGGSQSGDVISQTAVVITVTGVYSTCAIGHYFGYPGRLPEIDFVTGGEFDWNYTIRTDRLCQANCGSYLGNTHFSVDDWGKTGSVGWVHSIYSLDGAEAIYRTTTISATGWYSVSLYAKTASAGSVTINGETSIEITGASFAWYGTVVSFTAPNPVINVTAWLANPAAIEIDQICISESDLEATCFIQDPHLELPSSSGVWIPSPGSTHGASAWIIQPGNNVYQNIAASAFSQSSAWRAVVRAKSAGTSTMIVGTTPLVFQSVIVATGTWVDYVVNLTVPQGEVNLQIKVSNETGSASNLTIDYVCFYPSTSGSDGPPPCGISDADAAASTNYIKNGTFEQEIHFPWIECPSFSVGLPLGVGINCTQADTRLDATWWMGGITDGVYRVGWNGSGVSLGLAPDPLAGAVGQSLSSAVTGPYNIVFRMRRTWANSYLSINSIETIDDTTVGTWTDKSVYVAAGTQAWFTSGCNGTYCADPFGERIPDVVQIDSVYIVPGPEIVCGAPITNPVTPPGGCLNPDPMLTGSAWNVANGASIASSQAILPAGAYIQEMVPVSDGTTGGNSTGLIVGTPYSVTVAARLQSQSAPNTLYLVVGASLPGSQTIGDFDVSSQTMVQTFGADFTLTADMLSNGSAMPLRLLAAEGSSNGSVVVLYVCIRNEGGVAPPGSGICLGTWETTGAGTISDTIAPPDYVYNDYTFDPGMSYAVVVDGEFEGTGQGRLALEVGGSVDTFEMFTPFQFQRGFVAPANASQVKLSADHDVSYSYLCLIANGGPPITPPPDPLPYPECSSTVMNDPAIQLAGFYYLPQYIISPAYSGTVDSAAYAAELIYNYSVYPLVCTQLSIANWTYAAYHAWLKIFEDFADELFDKLDTIIDLLRALDDDGTNVWDFLKFLLELIWWAIQILLKILATIFEMFANIMRFFLAFIRDIRTDVPLSYRMTCEGEQRWFCLGIASVMVIDRDYGDWLNIVANIAVFCMSLSMLWWAYLQIRAMFEPESGGASDVS